MVMVTIAQQELAARLRKINLDLMPMLHELLRTKSVTSTARSFNMTQPAVSRALRQLRDAFDDQLLVSPGGRRRDILSVQVTVASAGPPFARADEVSE